MQGWELLFRNRQALRSKQISLQESSLYAMKHMTATQVGEFALACTVPANYNMKSEALDTTPFKKMAPWN
jgi:hypothetical protein